MIAFRSSARMLVVDDRSLVRAGSPSPCHRSCPRVACSDRRTAAGNPIDRLTARERQIFELMIRRQRNDELAGKHSLVDDLVGLRRRAREN
jgi:FixJ family two-component response regulator